MSEQIEMCKAVAAVLKERFSSLAEGPVTVLVEDDVDPAAEVERALAGVGVVVLVAATGHMRKPGVGASTAGDLGLEITCFENPKLNRLRKAGYMTVTHAAETCKDALHYRTVLNHRISYVDMERTDADNSDFRMTVRFVVPLALDSSGAVTWTTGGGERISGVVTQRTPSRGGVVVLEPNRRGDAEFRGVRDSHWAIELECTVDSSDESILPALGDDFIYGGKTYMTQSARMTVSDTSTVRLSGRTIA